MSKIMAWMEKRRKWLDARCRLPDIASPDKPVRFQELVWNEDRQGLISSKTG
ncbi:hypothetical protein ACE6ZO_004370 [Salmonella enterica]|nr:hypothetical protein [Salmonella enterica]